MTDSVNLEIERQKEAASFGFDPQEKVKEIDLQMLSRSIRIEGRGGEPLQVRPKQSWEMLAVLTGLLSEEGINYTLDRLTVQNQGSYVRLNDADKEAGHNKVLSPISRFEFEKVLAKISIPNLSDNHSNKAGIALNFHREGMEVVFGMNVDICSNWAILGGTVIRTYTHQGKPPSEWELNLFKLRTWVRNLEQLWQVEQTVMQAMKEHTIPGDAVVEQIIGDLYRAALKRAYFNGPDTPFDTHQLSLFVQEMLRQKRDEEHLGNVWDLYNWGTSILKPGVSNDMAGLQNSADGYSYYLCDRFGIPVPVPHLK